MKRRFWQFGSPSTLLFALLLFPLPWIEIQCPSFMSGKNEMIRPGVVSEAPPRPSGEIQPPDWPSQLFGYFFGPRKAVLLSQSGIQAACGWWSYGGDIDEDKPLALRLRRALDAGMTAAPLLGVYFWLLVIGCGTAFALRPGWFRSGVIVAIASIALLMVCVQLAIGLPLDHAYCQVPWRDLLEEPSRLDDTSRDHLREDIGYTAWFYMAQAALVLALLLQPAEWCFVYRRAGDSAPAVLDAS